jgi:hypothetical protein
MSSPITTHLEDLATNNQVQEDEQWTSETKICRPIFFSSSKRRIIPGVLMEMTETCFNTDTAPVPDKN